MYTWDTICKYEISFIALAILYIFNCSNVSLMVTLQGRNMLLRSRMLKFLVVSTVLVYFEKNNVFRCSILIISQLWESNSLNFVMIVIFEIVNISPFYLLCLLVPLFAAFLSLLLLLLFLLFFNVRQTFWGSYGCCMDGPVTYLVILHQY
jgi:hypothetical protein